MFVGIQNKKDAVYGYKLRGMWFEWKVRDNLCKMPFWVLVLPKYLNSEAKHVLTDEICVWKLVLYETLNGVIFNPLS